MRTSDQGIAALEMEEGKPLRAYRDVVGVWTIYAGLTAASGVVTPKAGMVITEEEGQRLLREALGKNYEPAVEMAMTVTEGAVRRPAQHEFDAGISFHFNTGGIGRASWVELWKARADRTRIRLCLTAWSKAGGKVLPALKARRERECAMLMDGIYRVPSPMPAPHPVFARWGLALSRDETRAVFDGLRKLGYDPGEGGERPLLNAVTDFQLAHDLTVDGIIGRATLSTLQRALDARAKAVPAAGATGIAIVSAANGLTEQLANVPHADAATIIATGIWLASHAWRYRDIVAASLAPTFPRIASYLRSF